MIKSDIANVIYKCVHGITKAESHEYVDIVFEQIKETLVGGENLMISSFGKFSVRHKHERIGRNTHTGELIVLDARRVLTFSPSSILKEKI